VVDVERWAELRRERFVRGVSIKELSRRTGLSRNTIRVALRSTEPPRYARSAGASKLDPFRDEIHRLLPGQRVRELIASLGFDLWEPKLEIPSNRRAEEGFSPRRRSGRFARNRL